MLTEAPVAASLELVTFNVGVAAAAARGTTAIKSRAAESTVNICSCLACNILDQLFRQKKPPNSFISLSLDKENPRFRRTSAYIQQGASLSQECQSCTDCVP